MSLKLLLSQSHWNESLSKNLSVNTSTRSLTLETAKEWLSYLKQCNASEQAISNAINISNGAAHSVVSGQQIGIGMNPILILYKLFALEVACKQYSMKLNRPVNPVFWLQTEDHDFNEISSVGIISADEAIELLRISPEELKVQDPKVSVGSIYLPEDISQLPSWQIYLKNDCHFPKQIKALLDSTYSKGSSLSEAFSRMFYSIFPDTSISLFDVRTCGMTTCKSELFSTALQASESISEILQKQSKTLSQSDSSHLVRVLPDSPLYFFHPNGPSGPRFRQIKEDKVLKIPQLNLSYSEDQMLELLKVDPNKFSTSALLRPILQDKIFSPLAYIGGNAEISYLRQVSPLYPIFGISEPSRLARPSALLHPESMGTVVSDSGIDRDFLNPKILESYAQQLEYNQVGNIKSLQEIQNTYFAPLIAQLKLESHDLGDDAVKYLNSLSDKLKSATSWYLKKAESINENTRESPILSHNRLNSLCFHKDIPQERALSVIGLIGRYGLGILPDVRNLFISKLQQDISDNTSS